MNVCTLVVNAGLLATWPLFIKDKANSKIWKPKYVLADVHVIRHWAIAHRWCAVRRRHSRRSTLTPSFLSPLSFSVGSIFRCLRRLFLHSSWRSCSRKRTAVCHSLLVCRCRLARFCHRWLACFFFSVTGSFFGVLHSCVHVTAAIFYRCVCCRRRPTSLPLALLSHTTNMSVQPMQVICLHMMLEIIHICSTNIYSTFNVTWQLRSANTPTLIVSQMHSSFGDRTFAARRTTNLEQSDAQSQTMWAVIRPVQAVTGEIFIQTVKPWRSVNCF